MKLRVIFKTPDAVSDAIGDLINDMYVNELSHEYDAEAAQDRQEDLKYELKSLTDKYVSFGEYVEVEFDTETGTATVVPRGK